MTKDDKINIIDCRYSLVMLSQEKDAPQYPEIVTEIYFVYLEVVEA